MISFAPPLHSLALKWTLPPLVLGLLWNLSTPLSKLTMVGSIQPEWVCGPVPPGDGRHGQAIEMISGIYAVHVLDQQRTPQKWYESFRKIWHRGGHKRDFNKTYRGARPDDHDYYKEHYEPGRYMVSGIWAFALCGCFYVHEPVTWAWPNPQHLFNCCCGHDGFISIKE